MPRMHHSAQLLHLKGKVKMHYRIHALHEGSCMTVVECCFAILHNVQRVQNAMASNEVYQCATATNLYSIWLVM